MLTDERVRAILKELNAMAEGAKWTWTQNDMWLGSCFKKSRFLQAQIIRDGVTIDDVLESWRTEPLRVECKTGLHILMTFLCIEAYGKEYFDLNMDRQNYSEATGKTTFFFSLPVDSRLHKVRDDDISDTVFPCKRWHLLDYVYLKGIRAYDSRQNRYPALTPSFQGENLLVLNPAKQLYVGFWHRGDGGKFLVRQKQSIQNDLLKKGRADFRQHYGKIPEDLGELAGESYPLLTVLSYHEVFTEKSDGTFSINPDHLLPV
jgi:hypothetical protein